MNITIYNLSLVILVSAVFIENAKGDCDDLGTLFYEDIGCKPVINEGESCPYKFQCDDFSGTENNTCLFQGKLYNASDKLGDELYENCMVGCFCDGNPEHRFTCAVLDCPEWLRSDDLKVGCVRKYELDKCCSTGMTCENRAKCVLDGAEFKEGEIHHVKDTCTKCRCDKDFPGKIDEHYCKRQTCAVQIHNYQSLEKNCAPYYATSEKTLCCPSGFVCPSNNETIKVIHENTSSDDLSCKFGSEIVPLGHGFEKTESENNFICECVLPPFLTCKTK